MITLCVPLRPLHFFKMVDVGSSFHLHHTASIRIRLQGSISCCLQFWIIEGWVTHPGNESCRPSMWSCVPHHHHLIAGMGIETRGGVGGDDGDVDVLDYLGSYGDDIYERARWLISELANEKAGSSNITPCIENLSDSLLRWFRVLRHVK